MQADPTSTFDDFYEEYGENLASRLKAIGHNPESRQAFIFVQEMGDTKEVTNWLANSAKRPVTDGFVLIWENFVEDIDDGGRDNHHLQIKGSLAVVKNLANVKMDKDAAIRAAHAQARAIVHTGLSVMLADALEGMLETENIQVPVRQLPAEKISALSVSWYGYIINFDWQVPLDLTLDETLLTSPIT